MSAVRIVPVTDGRGLKRFIGFPYAHYRGDPLWVPQLRMDMRTLLSPKKNPFFQHAEAQYFLALDGADRIVGRIAGITNAGHNAEHHDKIGFYGFFESVNDPDVARALFDAAGAWVKAKGMDTLRGPMSPSINDECGLLVEGFDTPPTLMMPHNPRYYVQLTEGAGFRKAMDLLCYQPARPAPPERVARAADVLAKRKGITLRPFNMKRFKEEVELIKKLYNGAWEKNWGFVAMTDAEIDHLAKQLKPVVIPDLIVFAEKGGETVGFAVALPDMNVALKKNPSGRLFPGLISILWAARKINRARILLLGTIPEYRGSGVDAMLYHWIWTKANAHGIFWGEGGWVLENNPAMKNGMIRLGFEAYKTYRVYDRPL